MLDNIVKQKNKFHSLYLHCIDIDWFRITCHKGHLMSSRFRTGPMDGDHPTRSLHCPECNRYISMDKCELLPTRLPYNDPNKGYGYVQVNGIATSPEPATWRAEDQVRPSEVEALSASAIEHMRAAMRSMPAWVANPTIPFPTIRRRHGTFISPTSP